MVEFSDGGKLAQAITAAADSKYLVAGSGGYGFIAAVSDMSSRQKAGKVFMSLEKGEKPLPPAIIQGDTVAVLSQNGKLLLFPLAELKEMAKGKGLMLIDLAPKDELVGIATLGRQALIVYGAGRGGKATEQAVEVRAQTAFRSARAKRGQEIPFKLKPTGLSASS
jgi:topoisomerase-4 subunit A